MCEHTSFGINAIKQQVRLLTAGIEIETEVDIRFAMECQKNAYVWALEVLGAAPADATLFPTVFQEKDFDFALFKLYCEVNDVTVQDVEIAFRDFRSFEHSLRV